MINEQTISLLDYEGKIKVDKSVEFVFLRINKDVKHKEEDFEAYTGHSLKFNYNLEPVRFDFKVRFGDLECITGDRKTNERMYAFLKNTTTGALIENFALTFHEQLQKIINGK